MGLDFYTAPCDGGKVKSCSRPRCRMVNTGVGKCGGNNLANTESERTPAATAKLERVQISVGTVVETLGTLSIHRDMEGVVKVISDVKKGFKVLEKDILETGENSKAKILFIDDNIMTLAPKSKLEIAKHKFDRKQKTGSTIINLLYGKVRNSISEHNHYDQKDNAFEVKTKSAVAGVRGTDFATSYSDSPEVTEVETLKGLVNLRSQINGEEKPVARGYKIAMTVERKGPATQSYFGMPSKMNDDEIGTLAALNIFDLPKTITEENAPVAEVAVNSKPQVVCQTPKADFNQCSWHCENNPKGAKTCRTELQNVKCARHRCAANGHWVDETRLPASFKQDCPAQGFKVQECDY